MMRAAGRIADAVARVPARVRTKLLFAFLVIVATLVVLGAVGLRILSDMNERNEELVTLQRKISAYRIVQHDTTRQLYSVSSALLTGEPRALDSVLRQIGQFGYELDRLQLVEEDEAELMLAVRKDYDEFIEIVTEAVELARTGDVDGARKLQSTKAQRLAGRLERLTNQLVNVATANMLDRIELSKRDYEDSRDAVIWVAVASVALAVFLGSAFSASILRPLNQISTRLGEIAGGRFAGEIVVANRDELGALAEDVNRTSAELGRLYRQIEERTAALQRSVGELEALGEVSEAINSSLEIDTVLGGVIAHATELSGADAGALYSFDAARNLLRMAASHEFDPTVEAILRERPLRLGEGVVGRAGETKLPAHVADIAEEQGYILKEDMLGAGYRSILAVPLLREGELLGGLALCRKAAGAFGDGVVELLETLANQSAVAVQNARLFRELEEKGRALEEASRHKSEFLANMSHELRTPMNAILGFAELIQDGIYGEVPEKVQTVLERIEVNGKHLLGLINDVLDLSKIEAGQLELHLGDYRMEDVIDTVIGATEALAAEKSLVLTSEVAASLPTGVGDAQRLTQVLLNLVGNAIKFTDAGSVSIAAGVEDGAFIVSIKDTGPGIPAEEQKKIFEEFHQADSSATRKKGGTGLGLAISRRIVEMHGGRIWVESAPGEGSRFSFSMPVRAQPKAAA